MLQHSIITTCEFKFCDFTIYLRVNFGLECPLLAFKIIKLYSLVILSLKSGNFTDLEGGVIGRIHGVDGQLARVSTVQAVDLNNCCVNQMIS